MKKLNYIENLAEWECSFHFSYPLKVRFSETDMFGHLNNTVPFVYFELARIEFFKQLGLMKDWISNLGEQMIVVADLQCDFLKQLYFDEQLQVYVKVHKVGRTSVDLHYMVRDGRNELCLAGRGTMVQVSKSTGKPIPWTEEKRKLFAHS